MPDVMESRNKARHGEERGRQRRCCLEGIYTLFSSDSDARARDIFVRTGTARKLTFTETKTVA